jgi:hypothetical protein
MLPETRLQLAPERAFAWADVPALERDWLRARTEDAAGLCHRVAADTVRLGALLLEVKKRLPHGTFLKWLAALTAFSRATAARLMRVGRAFGGRVPDVDDFEPSALYLLADPRVPPAAREYALELAKEQKVTRAVAREVIDAQRARGPEPSTKEMRALAPVEARPVDLGAERARRVGAAVLAALEAGWTVLHLSAVTDDEPGEPPVYSAILMDGARRGSAVRRTPEDAVSAAAGVEELRLCSGPCKAHKPVGEFGCIATAADGRNRYCKACERVRVKGAKKRRKAKHRDALAEARREAASDAPKAA